MFPVEFDASKAKAPTATFSAPPVFTNKAFLPTAVLLDAVVFADNDL